MTEKGSKTDYTFRKIYNAKIGKFNKAFIIEVAD